MTGLLLETLRSVVLVALAAILWLFARKSALHRLPGWNLLAGGVTLLIFGSLVGLGGSLAGPDAAGTADSPTREFLELVVGNLGGFLLVIAGLLKWLPELAGAKRGPPVVRGPDTAGTTAEEQDRVRQRLEHQVSRRKRAMQVLRASQSRLANALHIAQLGNWDWDIAGNRLYWSHEMYLIFDQPRRFNPTHEEFLRLVHPDDRERMRRSLHEALHQRKPHSLDYRILRPDGKVRIVHEQARASFDEAGRPVGMAGIVQDITERRLAEQALRRSERNLRALADGANDGILVCARDQIVFANRRIAEMLGFPVPDLIDKAVAALVHKEEHARFKEWLDRLAQGETAAGTCEIRFVRRDGAAIPVEINAANTLWYDRPAGTLVVRDITLRKRAEAVLARKRERAEGTVASLEEGVITTDVNGTVDHMNPVAERLTGWVQLEARGQPLAKVFNVIDRKTHEAAENPVAKCLREDKACRFRPAVLLLHRRGLEYAVEHSAAPIRDARGGTIGVVVTFREVPAAPEATAHPAPAAPAVVAPAAPEAPPGHEDEARRQGDIEWASRIARALEDKRFLIYYQPILPLSPQAAQESFFEILIRMLDEKGRLIAPMAFLPTAERNNLMPTIDRWVVQSAFEALRTDGLPLAAAVLCAVNVSGQSLGDPRFLDFVTEQLGRSKNDPHRICFQIAESAVVPNLSGAMRFVSALRERGCRFAIDDFGAGQGSFSYLRNLQVNYLKFPGSLVRNMINDAFDSAMVESLNQVGHNMGLQTIAKGVEDGALLERLRRLGVDYAQGYGVARPAPLENAAG